MRTGNGRGDPVMVDTRVSQPTGSGKVSLLDERLAYLLRVAPKEKVMLRIPGSVLLAGALKKPQIVVPREVKSFGKILKAIGNRIVGHNGPLARDANCAALAHRALR